jgi:geranylgeranyl diphosphate synthase type II
VTLATPRTTVSDRLDEVSVRLEAFFDAKEALAEGYGRRYAELWAAARKSSEGGKRFRPALVVNTYEALGGDFRDDVLAVATAFELLHTAFLLHDDVIDGDTLRRGAPNLVGTFSSRALDCGVSAASAATWGDASAILAGDLLIHAAHSQVARASIPNRKRVALLDLLDESMFVTAAGELADVAFSTTVSVPVLSEVLSMTQWKTAHYSFQAPLRAAAILAGASDATMSALGEYGRNVGIAFQLRDDILGVFGDERVTGKSAKTDLREGKLTVLMRYAVERDATGELRALRGREVLTNGDAYRARQIFERTGARAHVEQLIDDHAQLASAALDSPSIPRPLRRQLDQVALRARNRLS